MLVCYLEEGKDSPIEDTWAQTKRSGFHNQSGNFKDPRNASWHWRDFSSGIGAQECPYQSPAASIQTFLGRTSAPAGAPPAEIR